MKEEEKEARELVERIKNLGLNDATIGDMVLEIEQLRAKEARLSVPSSNVLCHAELLAERRETLCKQPPLCPDCETDQVQLTEWIEGEVAEWKCRHCRTRFKFERVA